jgi:hypothetical protein
VFDVLPGRYSGVYKLTYFRRFLVCIVGIQSPKLWKTVNSNRTRGSKYAKKNDGKWQVLCLCIKKRRKNIVHTGSQLVTKKQKQIQSSCAKEQDNKADKSRSRKLKKDTSRRTAAASSKSQEGPWQWTRRRTGEQQQPPGPCT